MEILTKSGFEREIERSQNSQEHFNASVYFTDDDKKEIANHFQEIRRFCNLGIAMIIKKQFEPFGNPPKYTLEQILEN